MTVSDHGTSSVKGAGESGKPDQQGNLDSVFKDGQASVAKQPTEHEGVHGTGGHENDLDRAEGAGREGGQR